MLFCYLSFNQKGHYRVSQQMVDWLIFNEGKHSDEAKAWSQFSRARLIVNMCELFVYVNLFTGRKFIKLY